MVGRSGVVRGSHASFFGKESYVVIGLREHGNSVCLGQFKTLLEASGFIQKLPMYRNERGDMVFSGGYVLTVPQRPIGPESEYWRFYGLPPRGNR
jgi:hypothetical protein